jgi:hypothetical protein
MGTDSIIPVQSMWFVNKDTIKVQITIKDILGDCTVDTLLSIRTDIEKQGAVSGSTLVCVNDSLKLQVYDFIRYRNVFGAIDSTNYWHDTARANANLERFWWRVGPPDTLYDGIFGPFKITDPGAYDIAMVVKDSLGCTDTVDLSATIGSVEAIHAEARIWHSESNGIYCPPKLLQFADSTVFLDRDGNPTTSLDMVEKRVWNFGDFKPPITLQDPGHVYSSNGSFEVTLVVTTV